MLFVHKNILEKEKKHLHISLAKLTEAISRFACELLPIICLMVCQWSTYFTSNETSIKKIQSFDLKVDLWVQ